MPTVASSGADHVSIAAWESAQAANPASAVLVQVQEAYACDGGLVTANFGNSNNVEIRITVDTSYRWYQQSEYPENMIGAIEAGARMANALWSQDQHYIMEYMGFDLSGTNRAFLSSDNNHIARYCAAHGGGTHFQDDSGTDFQVIQCLSIASTPLSAAPGAIHLSGTSALAENCLVLRAAGGTYGNGIYNTLTGHDISNCVSLDAELADFANDGSAPSGDDNYSSDATAHGTTNYQNKKLATWLTDFSLRSVNAIPTTSQVWHDDALKVASVESADTGDFNVVSGGPQAATTAAHAGVYGLETTDVTSIEYGEVHFDAEAVESYCGFWWRLEAGFSMSNGNSAYIARGLEADGTTHVWLIQSNRSGGTYRIRLFDSGFNQKSTLR